jgi:hypothetical protein
VPAAAPSPPRPAGHLARIEAVDARVVLERLAGAELIERGSVTLVSVEAIRRRAGVRWERKRDDVWAHMERRCDEHLSFQDIRQRVSETDLLIAMMTEEGVAAQATALKILEEVLCFFLGAAHPEDLNVRCVTGIDGDVITAEQVDLAKVAASRARGAQPACRADVDPREVRRRSPVSFVTVSGERVRVDFSVEDVVSLRHGATALLRVEPTVRSLDTGALIPKREFVRLDDDDILFIDRSTLAYGGLYLREASEGGPPILLPVSFRTMGARKGRSALVEMGQGDAARLRRSVMLELVDVDLGTPAARLAEVAALMGQLSRGVAARVQPARKALEPLRGARLRALTLDVRELGWDSLRQEALLRIMAEQMRGKAPALIAQGLGGEGWLARAKTAGFSHAAIVAPALTALTASPRESGPA